MVLLDIEMPKNCEECPLRIKTFDLCIFGISNHMDDGSEYPMKPPHCPLRKLNKSSYMVDLITRKFATPEFLGIQLDRYARGINYEELELLNALINQKLYEEALVFAMDSCYEVEIHNNDTCSFYIRHLDKVISVFFKFDGFHISKATVKEFKDPNRRNNDEK